MGTFGITGYSTSGKTPINYGLKAGQFRTRKYGVGETNIFINNNIGGVYPKHPKREYGCYDNDCCNNSMSGWFKWPIILGGASAAIGSILDWFAPKKEELGATDPETDEFAGLKQVYPKGEFIKITDNLYYAVVDGNKYDGSSIAELYDNIQNGRTTTSTEPPTKTDPEVIREWDIATAYDENTGVNGATPVKFEEGIKLADIFKELEGVYDHGKDKNGREIGDFTTAKVENIEAGKEYKEGDIIQIGGYNYKISIKDGYIFLEDQDTTEGKQIYILEKQSDGSYQLAQRNFIGEYTVGINEIAHHNK